MNSTGGNDQPSSIDMRAILDRMIDWTASRRGDAWLVALQLLVRAASDPPIAAVFQKPYAQFRRKLAKLLESGQAQGVTRADIAADLLVRSGQRDGRRLGDEVSGRAGAFRPRPHSRSRQRGDCHVDPASALNEDRIVV
jgi:hypothetical protein